MRKVYMGKDEVEVFTESDFGKHIIEVKAIARWTDNAYDAIGYDGRSVIVRGRMEVDCIEYAEAKLVSESGRKRKIDFYKLPKDFQKEVEKKLRENSEMPEYDPPEKDKDD